jgi:hypothetical protein
MHRDVASLPRHKLWHPPPSTSILWPVAYKVIVLLHSINHFACGWQVLLTKAGAGLRRSFHAPGLCSGEREGFELESYSFVGREVYAWRESSQLCSSLQL